MLVMFGRLQQRFRRDAAHVGAGASGRRAALVIFPFVDAGAAKAQLRSADGRDIAAGAAADDDNVKIFRHNQIQIL